MNVNKDQQVYNFASYSLLNLHSPAIGQEIWHCDMKRGFIKARKKEKKVKELLTQDNLHQRIGILAQQVVYEFHQYDGNLNQRKSLEQIRKKIHLDNELPEVQKRVQLILEKYHKNPILYGRKIIILNRGDEGYPQPILIDDDNYLFNLYAAIDCIFEESDGIIHILDLKTGHSDFDTRQGYIYLLAAKYLYPDQTAVASFYNLETQIWSPRFTATPEQLQRLQARLKKLAQKHQREMNDYLFYQQEFERVFPPNPGLACRYCQLKTICQFSTMKASVSK